MGKKCSTEKQQETKANDSLNQFILEANDLTHPPKTEKIYLENTGDVNNIVKREIVEFDEKHDIKDIERLSETLESKVDISKLSSRTLTTNSKANSFHKKNLFASAKTKFSKNSFKSENNISIKNGNLCKSVKRHSNELKKDFAVSKRPKVLSDSKMKDFQKKKNSAQNKMSSLKDSLKSKSSIIKRNKLSKWMKKDLKKIKASKQSKSLSTSSLDSKACGSSKKKIFAVNKNSPKVSLKSKRNITVNSNNLTKVVKSPSKKIERQPTVSKLPKCSPSSLSGAKPKESYKKKIYATNKVKKGVSPNSGKRLIIKRNNLKKRVKRQSRELKNNLTVSKLPKPLSSSVLEFQAFKQIQKISGGNETPKMFYGRNCRAPKDARVRFSSINSAKDVKITYPKELIRQPANLKLYNCESPNSSLTEEAVISFFEEILFEAVASSMKIKSEEKPKVDSKEISDFRTVKKGHKDSLETFISPKSKNDVNVSPSKDDKLQNSSLSSKAQRQDSAKKLTLNKTEIPQNLSYNLEVDSKEIPHKLIDSTRTLKKVNSEALGGKSEKVVKIFSSKNVEKQVVDSEFQNSSSTFSSRAYVKDSPIKSILSEREMPKKCTNKTKKMHRHASTGRFISPNSKKDVHMYSSIDLVTQNTDKLKNSSFFSSNAYVKDSPVKSILIKRETPEEFSNKTTKRFYRDAFGRLSQNSIKNLQMYTSIDLETRNTDYKLRNSSFSSSKIQSKDSSKKSSITVETPTKFSDKKPKRVHFEESSYPFKIINNQIKFLETPPLKETIIQLEDIKHHSLLSLSPPEFKSKGLFKKNVYIVNGSCENPLDRKPQTLLEGNAGRQLRKRNNQSQTLQRTSPKLVKELFAADLPESSVIFSSEPESKKRRKH